MPHSMSYTVHEIAQMLKVSKLTVYDLIKKGELRAYRVGKQMRVDGVELEAYKQRGQRCEGTVHYGESQLFGIPAAAPLPSSQLVITGHDACLELLSKHMERESAFIRPLRSFVGSMEGLIALFRGEAHIVSTHLFDGDTGEYNLPYIRKLLVGLPYMVIHVAARSAGLYVQSGNPKGIASWSDVAKPGIKLVNRERGSGARVLLDEQLRILGLKGDVLHGYRNEETTHLAVAGQVGSGQADVGVGIEKVAYAVGIDFVPLMQEEVDLVVLKQPEHMPWIGSLLQVLRSAAYREELMAIRGYDTSRTGEIRMEA
ncbi:helix-turn-helix transcriptional regulator [Paenibacillus apiarius]|uniref:Helix-turn-helix transcriptional regulator n=1 Tax=Paenibacillus apiarius TaxID=46240 RepID=A0ABT4E172_9BACL|nr:helix-turn-helix transcriptional regulator [Paenibacillus apiarius]MBN3524957.1 helix-turn-helix transcriptional regulator [Paenibacillus apiarius]MCY9515149.1 helix-turn-helix transcriptional regulator [Paenibacillus apiarius]MCY9522750.1 helix-turn-helix transcriptional regulator [Paenibacillus apiarius]MCY9552970.1 helix-turn-helix transcriptional regulator [Paenibacillus apiarius]MCY9557613.1 helix-turn-helix transcriptional regulator [Paenibacillus apiarius]